MIVHLGSMAFGSSIIAIVLIIKFLLYIATVIKNNKNIFLKLMEKENIEMII